MAAIVQRGIKRVLFQVGNMAASARRLLDVFRLLVVLFCFCSVWRFFTDSFHYHKHNKEVFLRNSDFLWSLRLMDSLKLWKVVCLVVCCSLKEWGKEKFCNIYGSCSVSMWVCTLHKFYVCHWNLYLLSSGLSSTSRFLYTFKVWELCGW